MLIADLFDGVAAQMRADFEQARAALSHPGLKGGAFENAFRAFLRKYLPARLDISQGSIVDASGKSSKQLDVIITDAHGTPIFYESGDTRVVPAEMVYAVIEVKAKLSVTELDGCIANMASVRALTKTAYQPGTSAPVMIYGKTFQVWPTNYYVFAIDSAPLESLAAHLRGHNTASEAPPERRIDTICVLNRGVICNQVGTNSDALPSPGSTIGYINTRRPLLLFYALTSRYWFQATVPPFNIVPYLRNMDFGEKEV